MPFTFASGAPVDQVAMPAMGWTADPAPAPRAAAPAVAQSAPQGSQEWKPSGIDIAADVLFNSRTPADAADHIRALHYQVLQQQMAQQQLQRLAQSQDPSDQDAIKSLLFNNTEYGKALGGRFAVHDTKAGDTTSNLPGGERFTAPQYGVSNDQAYALGPSIPGSFQKLGPQMPGEIKADTEGGLYNNNGPTGKGFSRFKDWAPANNAANIDPLVNGQPLPGSGALPQGGPASGALGDPSVAPAQAPPGIRNLNFGNLKTLPPGHQWPGQTGVDANGYAVFGTPQDGAKAALLNLQTYANQHGLNTVSGIINRWAPPQAGNPTSDYTSFVAKQLGVDPNQPLNMQDPKVQQGLLHGIFAFENGPQTMAAYRAPAGAGGSQTATAGQGAADTARASGQAMPSNVHMIAQGQVKRLMTPDEVAKAGMVPGTVAQIAPDKTMNIVQPPQYDSAWDRGQRDSFAGWEPVKQYTAIVKPSYDALIKNIGQMSGPAAYAILDTAIRTDNPGMGTRQAQLDSFEHKFGLGGAIMGQLLNYQGKGSIPLDIQQKIINSMVPFAQAHYDAARSLYDAQSGIAQAHGRDVNDLTVPIGDRPQGMSLTVPPAAQRKPGLYMTPKGPAVWKGNGWQPIN